MKTKTRGNQAENAVGEELVRQGYALISQNWKTTRCEIDIIAKKSDVIYFVEVKYRGGASQGEGLDYITPQKLRQMRFSGQVWNQYNGWEGDWRLLAASVTSDGRDYMVQEIIELD